MTDSATTRGRDLFIVDNSISGWTGLRYLEEWSAIARSFDVATGYFEVGALLALEGKWRGLEKLRILMGAETTQRTRRALLESVRDRSKAFLDENLESDKATNPFLVGVPGIVEALRSGQIEVRIYDKDKFHAKAYITHSKLEVIGSQALVGSSNFTRPGLTENIELNVQIQSAREVAQLQEWFEAHWQEATEATPEIIDVIERHTQAYTPFEVYAKALHEYFRGHELTANEWDEGSSRMFPRLDRYQQEAYWALIKIARQHGGALLCDGVGLGKTFVGLMLLERLIVHEGKRVVLFAPKAAKEGVWEPHLREYLGHLGGLGGSSDFSSLVVLSHTDLTRKGDFPERIARIAEQADAVLIDEAHHFRNPGLRGSAESGREPSRYYRLYDLLDPGKRRKELFLLTATPINNSLRDFRHLIELFTRRDETFFAKNLGINSLTAHFNRLEKELQKRIGFADADLTNQTAETREVLSTEGLFRALVVQRSRSYARESQLRQTGKAASFPIRKAPQVAGYSIRKTYGRLLTLFERAFEKKNPLFTLPMYYPLAWYKGSDSSIDPLEQNRQKQVVGLIRTNFLKRFESSVRAFELSCFRLMQKLLAFLEVHSETDGEKRRLERWKQQHAETLGIPREKNQLEIWGDDDDGEREDDLVPPELLQAVERLDRDQYDVEEMISETLLDLDQIAQFLDEARQFQPRHDDKLQKLIRLLKSKDLLGQKVLLFTEFADTGRYLRGQLQDAAIDGVGGVDSGTKGSRAEIIRRFSPYYNGSSSAALSSEGLEEIRILISTDVLSEGLNLQDATMMINYDIHWNPVRLMQRVGRVDRRMNPDVEQRLLADHPDQADRRGEVRFWNFLPPDELNEILTLFAKVAHKTLVISKTLGIEGKKLLTPDDDYEALKELNHAYEGTRTAIEDMHLEYQDLLRTDPTLENRLRTFPGALFSGREASAKHLSGVFFCYGIPGLDKTAEPPSFTESAGTTHWFFFDMSKERILEEPAEIVASIRSGPATKRRLALGHDVLEAARARVEKHIKNTHLKRIDAPVGVKAKLHCWMEVHEA